MLYFSFICPHLLYGVEVYANTSKSSLKRLAAFTVHDINRFQHCLEGVCSLKLA